MLGAKRRFAPPPTFGLLKSAAKLLCKDKARRIAVNIAKLRELLSRKKEVLRDVEACVRLVRTGFVERIEHR
jgi:hypothetical protein